MYVLWCNRAIELRGRHYVIISKSRKSELPKTARSQDLAHTTNDQSTSHNVPTTALCEKPWVVCRLWLACGLILVTSLRCVEAHPYSAHRMNFMLPDVLCMHHKLVVGRVSVEQGYYPVSTSQMCVAWNECIMCVKQVRCVQGLILWAFHVLTACGIYGGGAWSKPLYPAHISQNSWCVKRGCTVSCAWHEWMLKKTKLMETHHNSIE